MLQADSAGRVKLKLIMKYFSDIQPQEYIMILAILFGKSLARLSKSRW